MTKHLKPAHIGQITALAKFDGEVRLYAEESFSGLSWTLRYIKRWAEYGPWGDSLHTRSGMVFSVLQANGGRERFETMKVEALILFNDVRAHPDTYPAGERDIPD